MKTAWVFAVIGLTFGGGAVANEVMPDDVVYDEYGAVALSLSGQPGDPEEGLKVFSTKKIGNCVSCHSVSALLETVQFHGNVGPSLDGVGDRWNEAELRGMVANAKNTFEGTVMPSFYKTSGYIRPGQGFTQKPAEEPLPTLLTPQQIEDVVAYLVTLKE